MFFTSQHRPAGVVRFGGGLNREHALREIRAQGYTLAFVDGGALFFRRTRPVSKWTPKPRKKAK